MINQTIHFQHGIISQLELIGGKNGAKVSGQFRIWADKKKKLSVSFLLIDISFYFI